MAWLARALLRQSVEAVARYDSADYLKTEEEIKSCLNAVFEEPKARVLAHGAG